MRYFFPVILMGILLVVVVCCAPRHDHDPAAAVKTLTAAPTRVVWCQDAGNGSDAGAESDHLRLMGFDTEDGRGERAILSKLSNYAKPLLTPRGDRVVFSNRQEQKIYVVNWDGSGLCPVTDGFALAVWEDPQNSNVWVYAGTAVTNSTAMCRIRRHLLAQPAVSKLVWDKTPVDIDNFQLSADGHRSSGQFPWPICGILELPNGAATKLGDGCWPSLAPDNSYRFWFFDGAHRNLTLFDHATGRRWVVNINRAPGIGGFEVYHPRWSSHPRFMAMTGPYTVGDRDNRIHGGGAGVEIYIGRFSPDFQKIEQWARVTHNTNADFFPDVWIAGGRTAGLSVPTPPVATATAVAMATATVPEKNRQPPMRLVLTARPVEFSRIPLPAAIAPYRRALVVNRYDVDRVAEGRYAEKQIMVAHWAIRDGRVLPTAARDKTKTYHLVLEPFDEHPELEGERLIMDSDEFRLPLYYEIRGQTTDDR
ncbi:MAG: hypothetical protein NT011_06450 [Kiritimatiellaeota bacterium]|nr:hypothetical protein [Kiritimatiellota bacterium]